MKEIEFINSFNSDVDDPERPTHVQAPDVPPVTVAKKFMGKAEKRDRRRTVEILSQPIRRVYSQTVIGDIAYLCMHFPSKITDSVARDDGSDNEDGRDTLGIFWKNMPYIITCQEGKKYVSSPEEPWFNEAHSLHVESDWEGRWDYSESKLWLNNPDPMDPGTVFQELRTVVKSCLELDSEETYDLYVTWIMATYFYTLFNHFPYLDFTGTKGSGKSRALTFLSYTAFNAIMSPDFSGPAIFRLVEGTGGTVLLDEAENFGAKASEREMHVRTLIMQGYQKDQYSIRAESDKDKNFRVARFNLYSPKAMGHISKFDTVLEDRCIQISMKRSTDVDRQRAWNRMDDGRAVVGLRYRMYEMFLDHAVGLKQYRQQAEGMDIMTGRERDLWLPLITVGLMLEDYGCSGLVESLGRYMEHSHTEKQDSNAQDDGDMKIARFLIDGLEEKTWAEKDWWNPTEILNILKTPQNMERYDVREWYGMKLFGQTMKRLFHDRHRRKTNSRILYLLTEEGIHGFAKNHDLLNDPHKDPNQTRLTSPKAKPKPKTEGIEARADRMRKTYRSFRCNTCKTDWMDTESGELLKHLGVSGHSVQFRKD